MKKLQSISAILVFFCVLIISFGTIDGDSKSYKVISSTKEGQKIISEYNIEYVHENVYSILGIDIARGPGHFVSFPEKHNYLIVKSIKYRSIPDSIVSKYFLQVEYTFLEKNGRWLGFILSIIIFIIIWTANR